MGGWGVAARSTRITPFTAAVKRRGLTLVAEFKRRSLDGEIAVGISPDAAAARFEQQGARALSIPVGAEWDTSFDTVRELRRMTRLPILAKGYFGGDDFERLRAAGADAALLIYGNTLTRANVKLIREARMEVVGECGPHDCEAARRCGMTWFESEHDFDVLLVNARDLVTRALLPETHFAMVRHFEFSAVPLIAASGIETRYECMALSEAGYDGVLVGRRMMLGGLYPTTVEFEPETPRG